jgi:acetyltransferase-like isoleucine patch superfamily enzyme
MGSEMSLGQGLSADRGVIIGYQGQRPTTPTLRLGVDAVLRSGSVIYLGSRIGDRFATGHHVVVREDCEVGDDVSIWSNTVVDYGCRIGNRVKIHANCYLAQYTDIRDDAFMAPGVTVANDLYPGQRASAEVMSGPTIGEGAQLGVNVTVLPFVVIGEGCLVGAGSVVTRDLPAGSVAFGNPAAVRGRVEDLADISTRVRASEKVRRE